MLLWMFLFYDKIQTSVIRNRVAKKYRQYNGQNEIGSKDNEWATKYYTEN